MIIYGAGLAGLLTANILRRHKPVIREAQSELPNNHAAVLRFRSDTVSKAVGIPFREVQVKKAVKWRGFIRDSATLDMENEYSWKVLGAIRPRSIGDLSPAKRFIAPPDLISQLADGLNIKYNSSMAAETKLGIRLDKFDGPWISTVPMPVLMRVFGWNLIPEFKFRPIWSAQGVIEADVDVFQTIYYPEQHNPLYRASITGDHLILEFVSYFSDDDLFQKQVEAVIEDFQLPPKVIINWGDGIKKQEYGKLLSIDDKVRREFILAMTDLHNIYSLGRFGTWRQLLLDDLVHDISLIEKFISQRDGYGRRLQS